MGLLNWLKNETPEERAEKQATFALNRTLKQIKDIPTSHPVEACIAAGALTVATVFLGSPIILFALCVSFLVLLTMNAIKPPTAGEQASSLFSDLGAALGFN
jgi:hypothetical protein|tara:strand:+ start:49934 stop:50239 length:306 start_codon:yes stop_codon:yes gene_type:complete